MEQPADLAISGQLVVDLDGLAGFGDAASGILPTRAGVLVTRSAVRDRLPPELLVAVARLGAWLLMQTAWQAEVARFLIHDRYPQAGVRPAVLVLVTATGRFPRNGYREVW